MSAPDRRSRFPASRPRQGGRSGGETLAIVERPATLVQVTARKGRQAELTAAAEKLLSLTLPESGRAAASAGKTALWLQPGSWLVMAPAEERSVLSATLAQPLSGIAAVVDQSHGRCVLEVSGTQARAVLAKLCRLDLHERAFPAGASAVTLVGHVSCLVYRIEGAAPGFGLIVGSTFAEWLLDELANAAAAHGWRFTPADEVAA
ncbi:sarcosine oxidase subunit gamma [Bosea sp. (in: a-proteobacteria)]|uniref:sarcosine oxidase subunit gamma n=1 Tax=Bosea sp. (in: a-proteobacteria) TaxID=1871050 RepID=UPI002FC8C898